MLPRTIICEECGESARVRGYGRVEYDWQDKGAGTPEIQIRTIRLTNDCPTCGVRVQEHRPATELVTHD
jgi:hypothetical protein